MGGGTSIKQGAILHLRAKIRPYRLHVADLPRLIERLRCAKHLPPCCKVSRTASHMRVRVLSAVSEAVGAEAAAATSAGESEAAVKVQKHLPAPDMGTTELSSINELMLLIHTHARSRTTTAKSPKPHHPTPQFHQCRKHPQERKSNI